MKFPSIRAAEEILSKNRPLFKSRPDVLAIGVGVRDGRLKFLVTVSSIEAASVFNAIGELDGIPLSIEIAIPQAAASTDAKPVQCSI